MFNDKTSNGEFMQASSPLNTRDIPLNCHESPFPILKRLCSMAKSVILVLKSPFLLYRFPTCQTLICHGEIMLNHVAFHILMVKSW